MNPLPTVSGYTGDTTRTSTNAVMVSLATVDLYFSYATIVAFRSRGKLYTRMNDWGPTTGRHLNAIDGGDKAGRLDSYEFVTVLNKVLKGL